MPAAGSITARFSRRIGEIVNRLTILAWEGDLPGVRPSMTHEQALAIVEAASIYGISLGIHDDWPSYLAARRLLADPVDLEPTICVRSNMIGSTCLCPWERELLLPVMIRLLDDWLAGNGGVR